MEEKLTQEIAQIVEQIFAGKEEDKKRQRTEDALRESASTIETLTSELAAANEKAEGLEVKLADAETAREDLEKTKAEELKGVETTLEEKAKEIEDLTKQLEEKSAELEGIKKDAEAASRMGELEQAGVVREDKESQKAKVKEMSAEEFAAYKEDLVSIRKHILAELGEKKEEGSDEEKETAGEETLETPPPNVTPENSSSAAFNLEAYPSDDVIKIYADLGKAMAEAITKNK